MNRFGAPRTAAELAEHAGIDPRYAREWLEQQAVAGFVSVDGEIGEDYLDRVRFWLNRKQLAVLVHQEDPAYVSPLADMVAGGGLVIDQVVEAYRTGQGVPYAAYGKPFRDGQAGINRPAFVNDLSSTWIEAAPEVAARLRDGGRIADLGQRDRVVDDRRGPSLPERDGHRLRLRRRAASGRRVNADIAGVKVEFKKADASNHERARTISILSCILEVLHDLARPVEVLEAARRSLTEDGVVLVADEKVAEQLPAERR